MRENSLDAVVKFLVSAGFKFDRINENEYLEMSKGDDYFEVHNWGVKGYVGNLFCKCEDEWDEVLAFLEKKFS